MGTAKTYDNYPVWIVIISNLVSLSIYVLGFILIHRAGWVVSAAYLVFILIMEYRLIGRHCTSCFYYGKTCGFGKGRISSLFFKRGDASRFCNSKMEWKDMIPDLFVSLFPLVTGIILMILKFELVLLGAALLLIFLTTAGNSFIRGSLTCRYCYQRLLGCPAEQLFNKDK